MANAPYDDRTYDPPFLDRRQAGVELGTRLQAYREQDVVVLALPRGGVPVAFEVARALGAELSVFVVRKIGMPGHREFAVGAIASGNVQFVDRDIVRRYGIPEPLLESVIREERAELERRESEYRRHSPLPALTDRVVVLVDDGLATGSTMRAALTAVRQHRPRRIVVAVPVGSTSACSELAHVADAVVCARIPHDFSAVGQWYRDFTQTTDDEIERLLTTHIAGGTSGGNKGSRR